MAEQLQMEDVELNSEEEVAVETEEAESNLPEVNEQPANEGSVPVPDIPEINIKKESEDTLKLLRKSKTPEQEIELATKLVSLSSSNDAKPILQKQILLFITMLQKGPIEVQKAMLQLLQAISITAEAKKTVKRNNGIVEVLRCIQLGGELRHHALGLLGFLISKDEDNAQEFVDREGIALLRECLEDNDDENRFYAAACSWVLASHFKFHENMVELKFVEKCLDMITDTSKVSNQAMGTLLNLSIKNETVHQLLVEKDGLKRYKDALSKDSTVAMRSQQLIIQTLYVITKTNNEFKNTIRSHDLFPCLLELLESTKEEELALKILQLFVSLLAKNKENQDQFRELGGIILLNNILQQSDSETVKSSASTALWAATISNTKSVESLTEENIQFISQSLVLATQPVLVGLVATLSNIANSSEKGQNLVRERNMIPFIIDFLRGEHAPLLEATGGAIMALCRNNEANGNAVLESDGALLLANNLSAANNGVKQNVAGALRILLELNFLKTMKAIHQVDGIQSLLNMLREKTRTQLQINAAHCILLLVDRSSTVRDRIIALGGQFSIAAAIVTQNETLQAIICDIICSMAKSSEEFRAALGREDIVSRLIVFVDENDEVVLHPALRGLWAICLNNEVHQQIAKAAGVIELLIDQLTTHSTTMETKALMLKALASICGKNYKNQETFRLNEKGLPIVISSLLLSNSDEETNAILGEPTALVIWCLSTGNSRMQTTVREKMGLVPLVEMLRSNFDSPAIMINSMGALTELCRRCNANKKIVKDAGLMDFLSPLESHDNKTVADQAKELHSVIA